MEENIGKSNAYLSRKITKLRNQITWIRNECKKSEDLINRYTEGAAIQSMLNTERRNKLSEIDREILKVLRELQVNGITEVK